MPHPLFLSHDHRDASLAKILASTLERITAGQLGIWFSSDTSRSGGLHPGDVWLDEIRGRLRDSRAVIALLTPHSVSKPWLLFETGFGAGLTTCEIVPVCIGVSFDAVPFPLAMYQCSQLSSYESLKLLCSRLLARYDIPFDEELAAPLLQRSVAEFAKAQWETLSVVEQPSISDLRDQIQQHIDRRILDLSQQLIQTKMPGRKRSSVISRMVTIELQFPRHSGFHQLEITEATTVDDVTDNVYYWLEGEVEVFSYLKKWILRESVSDRNLVIREFGKDIPAHLIFTQGSKWRAVPLESPYTWKDSSDIDRWR